MDRVMIPVKGWSFGRWRRIGCMVAGLWWFDSPWLDCCSCSRRWRNHHLDSMQCLQNCVIISSGSHDPWDLSLWTVLPEDETSLPRLWRGWVLRPTESAAMEGEEGDWIVGSWNSNHFLPGPVVESKGNPCFIKAAKGCLVSLLLQYLFLLVLNMFASLKLHVEYG